MSHRDHQGRDGTYVMYNVVLKIDIITCNNTYLYYLFDKNVMLCYVMLCYVMLCYVLTLCLNYSCVENVMLCYVMLCIYALSKLLIC